MFKSGPVSLIHPLLFVAVGGLLLAGCSSAELRARQEQREKVVQTSKLYCEFVNGDNNPDIDVALNLAMGAKCDSDRSFSMTSYRTPSEINGVVFCCAVRQPKPPEPVKTEVKSVRPPVQEVISAPAVPREAKAPNTPVPVAPPKPAVAPAPPAPAPVSNNPPPSVSSEPAPSGPPKIEFVESPSSSDE